MTIKEAINVLIFRVRCGGLNDSTAGDLIFAQGTLEKYGLFEIAVNSVKKFPGIFEYERGPTSPIPSDAPAITNMIYRSIMPYKRSV